MSWAFYDSTGKLQGGGHGAWKFFDASGTLQTNVSGESSTWTYVFKPSDESRNTNTTLAADTDLLFAASANTVYVVEAVLFPHAANTTPDIKVAFVAPASSTGGQSCTAISTAAAASGTAMILGTRSVVDNSNPFSMGLYDDFIMMEIRAVISVAGTAGDIAVQWAQINSNATNTTVRKGSYIRYRPLS